MEIKFLSVLRFKTETMQILAFFLLATFAAVFAGVEDMKEHMQLIDDCKKSSGYNGNFKEDPATKEQKCFHECIMKKAGVMKDDGTLDEDKALEMTEKIKSKIPADKAAKITDVTKKCVQETKPEADSCETAYKLLTCFKQNDMMPNH